MGHFSAATHPIGITRRMLAYLRPYWRRVVVAYCAMAVVTLLTLAVPGIVGWVVDVGMMLPAQRTAAMVALPDWVPGQLAIEHWVLAAGREVMVAAALLLIVLALARSGFSFVQQYLGAWLSQVAAYDIRNDYFRHVQRLSFGFHDRSQTGDLMSRAIGDISKVQQFIGEGLLDAVNIPILFGAVAVTLLSIDKQLALVVLAPLLLLFVVTTRFGQVIEPRFKAVQDQEGVLSTRAQENFTGARVVRAFAREPWETALFQAANDRFYTLRIAVVAGFADYFPTMTAIVAFAMVLLLWFGGLQVLAGTTSLGTLISFQLWLVMLAGPTQNLGFLVNRAGEAIASARRFFEVMDTPSDILERPGAAALGTVAGRVTFEHVDFDYGSRRVLHDITFTAEPNQVVALFGPTGSGKTSVVNLIPRFYDVAAGAVTVDGVDVRDVTLDSLRGQIAVVLQDTFLFSATIRDNIAYGRLDVDEAAVVAAARAAKAHEFILELPEGYDTLIGERGVTLSGGQRQRLAIARAVLTQPRILILDDAMSAVDTRTEHEIREALSELMHGRTTFVIAQRLLTLKRADQIVVLDGGRIVERGTHAELVAGGGLYRRIYDLQLRDQEAVAEVAG
jgi:ATP-binding cassette, subfamily B, multidrug efflux pump